MPRAAGDRITPMVQEPGPTWTLRGALASGWAAARESGRAIGLIQAIAIGLAVAFYASSQVQAWTLAIGEAKARGGPLAAFVAGFVAGGVLPEIARLVSRERTRFGSEALRETVFVGVVYGVVGLQVDAFYWLQSVWFGHGTDVATIAKKVAVDMLLAAPLVFVPFTVGMFLWRERRWRLSAVRELFSWSLYRDRVLSIQVMNWVVWIPVLCAVYALPLSLQFPLAALVEACWSLLLVVMARAPEPNPTPAAG